jgi:serine/threonine protein kinase
LNHAFSPLERTVLPGTRLGRYEIITHLAAGGMATVFLARALGAAGFHRLVAIKLLHAHVAADQQFIAMFLDEARLAARIRHPNVVPTVDLQDGPEGHYLVMEYVEGDSLLGLLRQSAKNNKPMPAGIAIRVVLDALAGLHAAHELTGDQGEPLHLVHRDVSPHNILIGVDGVGRIVDFGVARAEERLGTTRDGQVKGKLSYMAPEQTANEPVDRRADVFTAGIVLWECLSGRRLFRGQSDAEVLRHLLDSPIPRLRDVSPAYPPALDDVCARALRRDPDERFDTAAEFAEELERAAEPLGIASQKQVGAYVRQVAGEVVDSIQRRVRAFSEGAKINTLRDSAPPAMPPRPALELLENADSAIRAAAPTSTDAMSSPPLHDEVVEVTRTRRPLVVGVAAAALVMVGAGVATVTLLLASRQGTPVTATPTLAEPQATSAGASAVAHDPAGTPPADSGPSISVLDLPRAGGDSRGHPFLGPKHLPAAIVRPSASAAPSVAPKVVEKPAATVNAAPAAPTSTAFNPESM